MSYKSEISRILQHQINNLLTKVNLLKLLPLNSSSLEKIRLYNYQIRIRKRLAILGFKVKSGKVPANSQKVLYLFKKIKQSHKLGLIAEADKQAEENLMASLVADKHISKSSF